MDINKADEVLKLLETFAEVRQKLNRLGEILETGRGDTSKRNIGGFLVSPGLYYRIYNEIKAEYVEFYEELKSKLK